MPTGIYIRTEEHLIQVRANQRKMAESRKGQKFSDEWRENLSKAHIGLPSNRKGKKHSEETRKKISDWYKLHPARRGKNHPSWKGGMTDAEYYLKNKEKINSYNKKWAKSHPEQVSFYAKQRYRRNKGAIGTHTLEDWENLKELYGYMCLCCKQIEPNIKLTEDHIIPLSKGGSNNIENIQPLCHDCNSRKNIKTINYIERLVN